MFEEISFRELKENMTKAIAEEWMLVTAGDQSGYNMMTASWGMTGEIWGNDAVMTVIRPQRYTLEFIQKHDTFTLSFYGDNKHVHKVCGNTSGKTVNKTKEAGLTPVFDGDSTYFEEARLVLVCRKQFVQPMEESSFVDPDPKRWYPDKDFHMMVIGKIEKVLIRK